MRTEIKKGDAGAALRRGDRKECLEFALLAICMVTLIIATYAMSLIATFDYADFYIAISFVAAGGSSCRACVAWRHSKMSSLERAKMEERRAARLRELEEAAAAARPASWAERIAKSESATAETRNSRPEIPA